MRRANKAVKKSVLSVCISTKSCSIGNIGVTNYLLKSCWRFFFSESITVWRIKAARCALQFTSLSQSTGSGSTAREPHFTVVMKVKWDAVGDKQPNICERFSCVSPGQWPCK